MHWRRVLSPKISSFLKWETNFLLWFFSCNATDWKVTSDYGNPHVFMRTLFCMFEGLRREAQITDYWLWDFFDSICGFSWGNFNHDACIYTYIHLYRHVFLVLSFYIETEKLVGSFNITLKIQVRTLTWIGMKKSCCHVSSSLRSSIPPCFFYVFRPCQGTSFSPNHRKPWTGIVTLDMPRAESWWSWSSFPNHSWNGGPHVLVPPVLNHDQLERPGCHMSCTHNTACRNVSGVFPAWRIHRRAGHAIYST